MTLEAEIRARIAVEGPIGVDSYMALAAAAYYAGRVPIGAGGDFVTAPEISQMFGEMLGAWTAAAWEGQGRPRGLLVELGPGRGTLMADALRVLGRLPGLNDALRPWLIETSPALRAEQARRLPGASWAERVEALPPGPVFVIANEFFDALPVRQHRRADPGWQERRVGLANGQLAWTWGPLTAEPCLDARFPLLPDGVVVETGAVGEAIAAWLGGRIAAEGGAALIVDYGRWDGTGDTLQAVRAHGRADPLAAPGTGDLTAHVRFRALAEAAGIALVRGPVTQGAFLGRLGIAARADRLAAGKDAETRAAIAGQLRRLTHPSEMGDLFRVMALAPVGAALPGFEDG